MKATHYLTVLTLLTSCSQAGSSTPTPTDPFLGHWAGESFRMINYDATGTVLTDQTTTISSQFDVTATTFTATTVTNGTTQTETARYIRNGESLTVTSMNGAVSTTYSVRSLTNTGFMLEYNSPRPSGQPYYVQLIPYRR
jgi:hypothetical protein